MKNKIYLFDATKYKWWKIVDNFLAFTDATDSETPIMRENFYEYTINPRNVFKGENTTIVFSDDYNSHEIFVFSNEFQGK